MKKPLRYLFGTLISFAVLLFSALIVLAKAPYYSFLYLFGAALAFSVVLLPKSSRRQGLFVGVIAGLLLITGRGIQWHVGHCNGMGFLVVLIGIGIPGSFLAYRYRSLSQRANDGGE